MNIPKNKWAKCKICGQELQEIIDEYGGGGTYRAICFKNHIKEYHQISLDEYFDDGPICPCGICGKNVGVGRKGANFFYKKYACGRFPGTMKWSEEAKIDRKGNGNPMYGSEPWNKGLDKTTSKSLMSVSSKMSGRKVSSNTKKKQSISAKKRSIHGHTGKKHSEESKNKMREATLKRIKNGDFLHLETKPHQAMQSILANLNIEYVEEYVIDCWSFDFYLPKIDILLEVDGDYFHSNPKLYPDGPITNTQKINWYRDQKKNQFCNNNSLDLIRFWECDILGNEKWILQKLSALKK